MKRIILLSTAFLLLSVLAFAQKQKSTEKEVYRLKMVKEIDGKMTKIDTTYTNKAAYDAYLKTLGIEKEMSVHINKIDIDKTKLDGENVRVIVRTNKDSEVEGDEKSKHIIIKTDGKKQEEIQKMLEKEGIEWEQNEDGETVIEKRIEKKIIQLEGTEAEKRAELEKILKEKNIEIDLDKIKTDNKDGAVIIMKKMELDGEGDEEVIIKKLDISKDSDQDVIIQKIDVDGDTKANVIIKKMEIGDKKIDKEMKKALEKMEIEVQILEDEKIEIENTKDAKVMIFKSEDGKTETIKMGCGEIIKNNQKIFILKNPDGDFSAETISIFIKTDDLEDEEAELLCSKVKKTNFKVNNLAIDKFNIFPNPNDGQFNLSFDLESDANAMLRIFDLNGKVVYKERLKNLNGNYNKALDLSKNEKGVYFLNITQGKNSYNKKFIIQ